MLIFFLSNQSLSQHAEIDQMIERALAMRGSNPDSSVILLKIAEKKASDANYFEGEMLAAHRWIRQSMPTNSYEELNPKILRLQNRLKGTPIEKYAADFDFIRGTILMQNEKVDSAVHSFKKAIEWFLKLDMKDQTTGSYVNLSKLYLRQHNYPLVRESLDKAYDAMQSNSKVIQYITLLTLTRASFAIKDFDNYSKYLLEAQILSKSFNQTPNDRVSEHALAKQLFNIEDDSLKIKLEESLPALNSQQNNYPLIIAYTTLGVAYQEEEEYDKAQEYFNKRLELDDDLEGRISSLSYLYENSKLMKDDKASLKFLEEYYSLKDSIFEDDTNEKIAEYQVQLQTAEKDYKIRAQQKQRNILVGSLMLFGLFGTYVVYTLIKRNRLSKKIFDQQTELDSQKIKQLKKDNQLTRTQALLEGQERERTRIANDLHDGLGGLLSTVKAHYNNIKNEVVALREMQSSGRVENMIDEACGEVRRISHDLMPNVLRLDGLQSAVEEIAINLKMAHGIEVDLEILNLGSDLDNKKETFIFRILQELTNNIAKYANANNVVIQLNRFEKEIVILIEDDGIGFDLDAALKKDGLGLNSTISRVEYLKGEIDINTSTGKGTSVTINIPLDID